MRETGPSGEGVKRTDNKTFVTKKLVLENNFVDIKVVEDMAEFFKKVSIEKSPDDEIHGEEKRGSLLIPGVDEVDVGRSIVKV